MVDNVLLRQIRFVHHTQIIKTATVYQVIYLFSIIIDNRQYLLVLTHLQYMVMTHKERYTCNIYIISIHVGGQWHQLAYVHI